MRKWLTVHTVSGIPSQVRSQSERASSTTPPKKAKATKPKSISAAEEKLAQKAKTSKAES